MCMMVVFAFVTPQKLQIRPINQNSRYSAGLGYTNVQPTHQADESDGSATNHPDLKVRVNTVTDTPMRCSDFLAGTHAQEAHRTSA